MAARPEKGEHLIRSKIEDVHSRPELSPALLPTYCVVRAHPRPS